MTPPSGADTRHHRGTIVNNENAGGTAQPRSVSTCEVSTSENPRLPLMVDIMSGPNSPLTKGFIMAQWRALPIDRLFGEHHDISDITVQAELHEHFKEADFMWAAIDCSTKTMARTIPSKIQGKRLPPPLRSHEYPMGLPGLQGSDKERVTTDNDASEFVLSELKLHQARSGVSGRENPQNSLHWSTPTEIDMWNSGSWQDTLYHACCLQGTRRKRQKIRHDIEEILCWSGMKCRHMHHPDEWEPIKNGDGTTFYPSHEEAEYTANLVFHIVVAASVWACRVGKAVIKIPRLPTVTTVGDKISWLQLDSRASREWAMIPMALAIGLNIGSFVSQKALEALPTRKVIQPTMKEPMGTEDFYVGQGNHQHRQPTGKWASPFLEGQDGTKEECLIQYGNHLRYSGLVDEVWELKGKRLWCDCPYTEACVADILIAAVYEEFSSRGSKQQGEAEPRRKMPRRGDSKWTGRALTTLVATSGNIGRAAAVAWDQVVRHPPLIAPEGLRWPQESVIHAFQSHYPEGFFDGFTFPFIEDIVNTSPFVDYANWKQAKGEILGQQQPPQLIGKSTTRKARGGQGIQIGAFAHKAAVPPVVSFGLQPDEHFKETRSVAAKPLPNERPCTTDPDLSYAAEMMVARRETITSSRWEAVHAVKQLKHRWRSVTGFLRRKQRPTLLGVTRDRDIGLIPLLAVLMFWPDVFFAIHLIHGFPAVGHCEWSGVYPRREVSPSERFDVFKDAEESNERLKAKMRPGKDDDIILTKSMQDVEKGFASNPVRLADMESTLEASKYRFIRRFVITQSTGKSRIIDDAADGGQSDVSTDENALCFCSATQPAHHMEAIQGYMKQAGMAWPQGPEGRMQTAGEDWPDAYRYTPMNPTEAEACIVIWWHPQWNCAVAQRYNGLLFGLPNAVTSFNRWSRLAEAMARRLLMVLMSMYFDDATMQDWAGSIHETQKCVGEFMKLMGSPWASAKSQPGGDQGDFLGLIHDLTEVQKGTIRFWPREALVKKVTSIIHVARESGLQSGVAAKLYGICNFLETGMFARVGRAGLTAIRERQYDHQIAITLEIGSSFNLLCDLFKMQPRREYWLVASCFSRILVASDAAYENGRGSAGFLAVLNPGTPNELRVGRVIDIPPEVYQLWGDRKTYIAQLELLAVFVAVVELAGLVRRSHGLWCIDNVAALMALVKGCSGVSSMDQMAKTIHLGTFSLEAQAYYEYVESKANWSDEISREGMKGRWAAKNKFSTRHCGVATLLLQLPSIAIVVVFGFL